MKPKTDFSKPLQTRDGHPAKLIYNNAAGPYPLVALITRADGTECPDQYTVDGGCFTDGEISNHDLVNVPPVQQTVRLWVIIDRYGNLQTRYYLPADLTGLRACKEAIIHITEGEGLEVGDEQGS